MIVIRLADGLGNQMFQYAYGKRVAKFYNTDLYLDCSSFANNGVRRYSLGNLSLTNENIIDDLSLYHLHYSNKYCLSIKEYFMLSKGQKIFPLKILISAIECYVYHIFHKLRHTDMYLTDYAQSESFFLPVKENIKKEFLVSTPPSDLNKKMLIEIANCNSVCVHIRRGDYLNPEWSNLQVCTKEYFEKGIDILKASIKNPIFYIFSNSSSDLEYIRENFGFTGAEYRYVDLNNSDYEELRLMYSCKHFIISNSSFSWWAQYLSQTQNKIVVAPKEWIKGDTKRDIYQKEWILI